MDSIDVLFIAGNNTYQATVHLTHLPPKPNGRHFTYNIFKCIFTNEKNYILIQFSLEFDPEGPFDNELVLSSQFDLYLTLVIAMLYVMLCYHIGAGTKWPPMFRQPFQMHQILNENVWITIKISLMSVPKGSIDNIPALVQIMVWRRSGDMPLSEATLVRLPTHICITEPQWVIIG